MKARRAKEATTYAKQRAQRSGGKFRGGISNADGFAALGSAGKLLLGISINDCLHCADGSYDDVLNRSAERRRRRSCSAFR